MTAFLSSHLPTGTRAITTYEELAVWTAEVLRFANAKEKRVLKAGEASVNCVQSEAGVYDADSVILHNIFISIPMKVANLGTSLPAWKKLDELSTTAASTSFQG